MNNEINFSLPTEGMYNGGFNNGIKLSNGEIVNAQLMKISRGITPTIPLRISLKKNDINTNIKFLGVQHQSSENDFNPIPNSTNV